ILGYGRIGREVAKRAVGFGCKVIAANRSPIADPTLSGEVFPLADLDRMLPQCDALVIAAGLAPETQGLINARCLALMKPTALLVNIAGALPARHTTFGGEPGVWRTRMCDRRGFPFTNSPTC